MNDNISSYLVPEADRMDFVDKLFGIHFPLKLEPTVFCFAEQLAAPTYNGGHWHFFALSNGGFYMAPRTDTIFKVNADNGFSGQLSGDALGITACLYAYSHLSFGDGAFAETCAQQYHLLREYMLGHAEVKSILAAID
ncbi:MAG: antirestriction protein [Rhodoferax sp.]|uniref:antirestriction protein n=1 Tax=Rhodoferax sp. TaxID=50421 RepID=UPI0018073DC7|nr:antirestriction protein [Rhodoferax sp.]NMM15471.1 antirestriction protein [Rhodoferax sp.]